jgi:hypothetical protein
MKRKILKLSLLCSYLAFAAMTFAQSSTAKSDTVKIKSAQATDSKEVKGRDVQNNASSMSSPRDLNIGLPSTVGGLTILENNMPVVYFYWPELPYFSWRMDGSFNRVGLLNLPEVSNTIGTVGYALNTYDRWGTDQLHGTLGLTTNHFGLIQLNAAAAGPLKNNWYYTVSGHFNLNPNSYNPGFTRYSDKTQIFKAGVTKRYKNGELSFLYKFSRSRSLTNYNPFYYHTDGSVSSLPNFKFGLDSYLPADGYNRTYNMLTGKLENTNLDKDLYTTAHSFDIVGKNNLGDGWDLEYTGRYHYSEPKIAIMVPAGTISTSAFTSLKYADNGQTYTGNSTGAIQMFYTLNDKAKNTQTAEARIDLSKKFTNHSLRFGFNQWYYNVDKFTASTSLFLTEIAPNPRKLVATGAINTDQYGYFSYNTGSEYHNGWEDKLAFYITDDWKLTDRLQVNLGARLEAQVMNGDYMLDATGSRNHLASDVSNNYSYAGYATTPFHNGWIHKDGSINVIYKITKPFGILGSVLYNEKHGQLENYSGAFDATNAANALSKTILAQGGIYYNIDKTFSLVSQVTYATRTNATFTRATITNPTTGESQIVFEHYGVKTLGWTTDIITNPFKNFNLHLLLTLQDPKYTDFSFDVTWPSVGTATHYDFSNKSVTAISKTLIEIDPSYTYNKFRFWAMAHYFGQQYANISNALIYKGRWETFVGTDYQANQKTKLSLQITNPLNQKGVQGTISSSDLITNSAPYEGKIMGASYIIPFTVQFSIKYNF